jgi:nitrogen regulatory protein P-II 1
MKMIIAFMKPNKFEDVMFSLHQIDGLTGASSWEVRGFGRDRSKQIPQPKQEISLDFKPHIRLEVVCRSDLVESVISVIRQAAHTGLSGDGKIYVLALEESVRIRTGECGESAV